MSFALTIDPRPSFSDSLPGLQVAWDSHSVTTFKKCRRRYFYSIVLGLVPKHHLDLGRRHSLHLEYGILYHRALELYDHAIADGKDHEAAIRFALWDLVAKLTEPDGTWWNTNAGLGEVKAARNTKTVPNLFRTVLWYLDKFGVSDPAKTLILDSGKPAVELSFSFETGFFFGTGEKLLYCGHMDRMVEFMGGLWVLDRKTTQTTIEGGSGEAYFKGFSPNNQMSGYAMAGNVVFNRPVKGVIIDAAQIAMGFSRFIRHPTPRSEEQLDEWLNDLHYVLGEAERCAEEQRWPMNDTACDDFGGCVFRDFCSKSPSVREIYLKTDLAPDRKWDPLEVRGDI